MSTSFDLVPEIGVFGVLGVSTAGLPFSLRIGASTEINASQMKKSSDCSQATSPRGHSRKYEKTSLIGLEEESIPLFDPANAFNSSTLEINVENSSTSDSSNSSASKYKVDLMHV